MRATLRPRPRRELGLNHEAIVVRRQIGQMSVRLTLNKFPVDARTKDNAGLPFGCVVQPFARETEIVASDGKCQLHAGKKEGVKVEQIGRCSECFAYINRYCYFDYRSWSCSLCGAVNPILKKSRYHNIPQRPRLAELSSGFVDLEYESSSGETDKRAQRRDDDDDDDDDDGDRYDYGYGYDHGEEEEAALSDERESRKGSHGGEPLSETALPPAFIALVDTSGTEDQLELVKSAILAGLEGLPPNALFGLATFSENLGIYDVQGKVPSVRYVPLPCDLDTTEEYTNDVLKDVVPLKWFLAPVGDHKEAFTTALESIGTDETTQSGKSCFGAALMSLVAYVSGRAFSASAEDHQETENPSGVRYSRVMTFLLNPPSAGEGRIDQSKKEGAKSGHGISLTQTFYSKMGFHTSWSGVSCDLYIMGKTLEDYYDLASMRHLSMQSGGRLFYYGSLDECTAPQDLFRTLSEPCAMNGTFRIRTTQEYKVSQSYGQVHEHHKYKNLYKIAACDQTTCFGFDFKFTSSGFSRDPDLAPTVQLAFQYTVFAPQEEGDLPLGGGQDHHSGHGKLASKGKYVLKRRLRIYTKQVQVAKSILDLYDYVDAGAVVTMLIHKCGEIIFDKGGFEEARSLVEDWVINLTGEYNLHLHKRLLDAGDAVSEPDIHFKDCRALKEMPYLVYGLLRGHIFSRAFLAESVDKWVYLYCAYTSNPPRDLARAIYPALSSYSDDRIYRKISLSWEYLGANDGYVYMLDSFFKIVVYYTEEGLRAQTFPPPHDGIIRREIMTLKAFRGVAPLVVFIRRGIEDERPFAELLLEEPAKSASGSTADYGFGPFMDVIKTEVVEFLANPPR